MTKSIQVLLLDDEHLSRANIRLALKEHPGWLVAAECDSVASARQVLLAKRVDVVFLDIQMSGESGMVLARELAATPVPPIIIFTTAYQHYAVQAFEFHALDYLLKPFDDQRFAQALRRAGALLELRNRDGIYGDSLRHYVAEYAASGAGKAPPVERLCIRSVGQIESVRTNEIDWILSAGNYVELHLAGRTILHRSTLSGMVARVDPELFLRVHRRALVRHDQCAALHVTGDGTYALTLRCGDTVPVSERYVASVRQVLV